MKNLSKFAMCAMILPVGAFAAGAVVADDEYSKSATQQSQESQHDGASHGRPDAAGQSRPGAAGQSRQQSDYGRERADRQSADRDSASDLRERMASTGEDRTFMSSTPDGAVRADNIIGKTLHTLADDEDVGSIDDLILDGSGKIVAVVVSVGGVLGMGQHNVAVSWDSIQRRVNDDRDGYRYSVNATKEQMRNAPEYDKDSTGIRSTGDMSQSSAGIAGQSRPGVAGQSRQQSEQDRVSAERKSASDRREGMASSTQDSTYMSTMPDGAVRIDNVIGQTLYTRDDNDVGSIKDLIVDESGKIVAVIVSVGGILGMGQSSVAVSWDSVERSLNDDRDGYRFTVNATKDEIRNASKYDKDSTGIRSTGTSSTN